MSRTSSFESVIQMPGSKNSARLDEEMAKPCSRCYLIMLKGDGLVLLWRLRHTALLHSFVVIVCARSLPHLRSSRRARVVYSHRYLCAKNNFKHSNLRRAILARRCLHKLTQCTRRQVEPRERTLSLLSRTASWKFSSFPGFSLLLLSSHSRLTCVCNALGDVRTLLTLELVQIYDAITGCRRAPAARTLP